MAQQKHTVTKVFEPVTMTAATNSTRRNLHNVFDARMATLDQIDRILMTDTLTIAQFVINRRKYILRNTEGSSLKGKNIGFMNVPKCQLKMVGILVNVIKINNKQEINQPKYLKGLAVEDINEIATKLHAFTRSTSNRNKPCIYLWEFKIYALINPKMIITPKKPTLINSYSNLWSCKNKLLLKIRKDENDDDRSSKEAEIIGNNTTLRTSDIYYCYARLIPTEQDLPTFNICTSPFIIGRRTQTGGDNVNWPSHVRSAISHKHCTITHDFTKNTTFIQVNDYQFISIFIYVNINFLKNTQNTK